MDVWTPGGRAREKKQLGLPGRAIATHSVRGNGHRVSSVTSDPAEGYALDIELVTFRERDRGGGDGGTEEEKDETDTKIM